MLARVAGKFVAEHGLQLWLIAKLLIKIAEAFVCRQVFQAQCPADVLQGVGFERPYQHQWAVLGFKNARQGHRRPVHLGVGHHDHRGFLHLHGEHGVVQGDADFLTHARACPVQQCQQNALHHVHAGRVVGQRRGVDRYRHRIVGPARHHATHGLRQHILPSLVGIGAAFAITGAHGINDAWVDLLAVFKPQAHALHHAGAEIIDHDVSIGDQSFDGRHLAGVAQVQCGAAFVAVEAAKNRVIGTVHRLEGRPAQIPRTFALDLENVCAIVGQHLGAHRPHHHLREINHPHAT